MVGIDDDYRGSPLDAAGCDATAVDVLDEGKRDVELDRLGGHVEDRIVEADIDGDKLHASVAELVVELLQAGKIPLNERAGRVGEDQDEGPLLYRIELAGQVAERAGQESDVGEVERAELVADLGRRGAGCGVGGRRPAGHRGSQ